MADVNEIRALKASLRGAIDTASTLEGLREKVEALDEHAEVDNALIEELGRLTVAHAVASNALRGLVEAMRARRGIGAPA